MSEKLLAVARTRTLASSIIAASVRNIAGKSEAEVHEEILSAMRAAPSIYESGWYSPPPGGVSVIFGNGDYERLQYDSLRNPMYFPRSGVRFDGETVAQLYLSPVDRATGLFGDFDCTIYAGNDERIRTHIKTIRDIIVEIAHLAQVEMQFSELYQEGQALFSAHDKTIGWMSTVHDPLQINLGHTMPGSYESSFAPRAEKEIVQIIGSGRVYINAEEVFRIPETCAFTVEARLTNSARTLPNVMFHVIVCFSDGKKSILTNFDEVFKAAGMDYML